MYSIIIFLTLFLNFSLIAKTSCFSYKGEVIEVVREKSVTLKVQGKKKYSGLYFCLKNKIDRSCQGDDDSGSFNLSKNKITLNSSVTLGNPDESYSIKATKKKTTYNLKDCTNF